MAGEYADWRGHVIVCGLRGVGLRIIEQLSLSGVPAVVIDHDPDTRLARILASWNVPHIAASSRASGTLARAGLAGATAVICAHQDDLYTLGTALLTRRLRADVRVVVQLGNPAVGRALAQAGVSVLDVAGLSAPSVVELCLRSDAREIVLSGERFIAARTTAPRSASLRELYGALAPVAVVSAADGEVVVCPGRDAQVAAGDEVTLVGTPDGLRAAGMGRYVDGPGSQVPSAVTRRARYVRNLSMSLLDAADRRLALALAALATVLIASTVVLRLAYHLTVAGSEVVVVEKDDRNLRLGQVRRLGVPVVIADATLPQVLESVRLASASAVAVLTSDDLANLETGLAVHDQLGRRWDSTPVVLRIFDPQLARSVKESFGFHFVRSTAALAAVWFVGAALGLDVLSTFYVGDELLLVARLTITPDGGLHGLQMNDLGARTRVLAIRRAADKAILEHLPRRATRFEPDDEAYLIGPYDELLTVLRRDRPAPRPPGLRLTGAAG